MDTVASQVISNRQTARETSLTDARAAMPGLGWALSRPLPTGPSCTQGSLQHQPALLPPAQGAAVDALVVGLLGTRTANHQAVNSFFRTPSSVRSAVELRCVAVASPSRCCGAVTLPPSCRGCAAAFPACASPVTLPTTLRRRAERSLDYSVP